MWWQRFKKIWFSWPQCKKYTLANVEGGGGQETGTSVGWGNSPETVWVMTLSLPWQPQRPFPFSACCSCVAAHLLSHVHLGVETPFKQSQSAVNHGSPSKTPQSQTLFLKAGTQTTHMCFHLCVEKQLEIETLTVFYCSSFLRAVFIMASITYSSLLFTEHWPFKGQFIQIIKKIFSCICMAQEIVMLASQSFSKPLCSKLKYHNNLRKDCCDFFFNRHSRCFAYFFCSHHQNICVFSSPTETSRQCLHRHAWCIIYYYDFDDPLTFNLVPPWHTDLWWNVNAMDELS